MTRGEQITKPIHLGEPAAHQENIVIADKLSFVDNKHKIVKQQQSKVVDDNSHLTKFDMQKLSFNDATIQCELDRMEPGLVDEFDHVTFWVGNAKHSASFYMSHFGFKPHAFRGLENGYRKSASHVLKLGQTMVQFVSAVEPDNREMGNFLTSHGDAVKDVAFRVRNIESVVKRAQLAGAEIICGIECDSMDGLSIKRATIKSFGDVTHTFIERQYEYDTEGCFLPGYTKPSLELPPCSQHLEPVRILRADHIVGQFPPSQLDSITEWYSKVMNFRRYWSVDEHQIYTEHSGVKSHVVTNHNERIKMPLCEVTLSSKAKSKAEEFVRYNNGSGIHHIALLTDDIVSVVANLRSRGMQFLNTPDKYYEHLRERLQNCPVDISEDIEQLKKLKILVDFDENGYLLQIFTRPLQDRPTLVIEFIQRMNHDGFGAGNFLALFKAIEAETAIRGNL